MQSHQSEESKLPPEITKTDTSRFALAAGEPEIATKEKPRKQFAPPDAIIAYTVKDASAVIGFSRSTLFKLIKEKKLRSVFVAGRRLIPAEALRELLSDAA